MDDAERESSDQRIDSPLDRVRAALLPGMESEVLPAPCSDEDVERFPRHTAERLLELHPDRYALATALFFGCPTLSGRQICKIVRISPHSLAEIIRREESGRTAAEWSRSAASRLRALADMAMSVAGDLMSDEDAVRDAGLKGVASILRESTHAHALIEGRLPGQSSKAPADGAEDYVESIRRAQAQSIPAGGNEDIRAEIGYGEDGSADGCGGSQDD